MELVYDFIHISLFALTPAVVTCFILRQYKHPTLARLSLVVVILSFFYWYFIPGALFFLIPDVQGVDKFLTYSTAEINAAAIVLNASFLSVVICVAKLPSFKGFTLLRKKLVFLQPQWGAVNTFSLVILLFSIFVFISRFSQFGTDLIYDIISGSESARSYMNFQNSSISISSSLIALIEILSLFSSVFIISLHSLSGRLLSISSIPSFLSVLVLFVASGSRSILTILIISIIGGFSLRITQPSFKPPSKARVIISVNRVISFIFIIVFSILISIYMTSRFESDSQQSSLLFLNSFGSHNDMFRELVFTFLKGGAYNRDLFSFLLVPFQFLMPTFLGFTRTVPPHLADYNLDRAGIDIIHGSGNVFPGIIADVYISYGILAPIVLGLFTVFFLIIVASCTIKRNSSLVGVSLYIVLLSYYFVSFRNVQSSLALLSLYSFFLASIFRVPPVVSGADHICDTSSEDTY